MVGEAGGVNQRLLAAEAEAFSRLEDHCADCWPCRQAEAQGLLLDHHRLCPQGRELADAWDAAEAAIAASLLRSSATWACRSQDSTSHLRSR